MDKFGGMSLQYCLVDGAFMACRNNHDRSEFGYLEVMNFRTGTCDFTGAFLVYTTMSKPAWSLNAIANPTILFLIRFSSDPE